MKNFIQPGDTLTLVAPYTCLAGQGALVGAIFGVAKSDVLVGVAGEFMVEGVFEITKVGSQAWTQGQRIFWDNTNKRCTSVATAGQFIGTCTEAVGVGAGVVLGRVAIADPSAQLTGSQTAIVALVDSSGGAAADGTIGLVTAPTTLVDNGAGTADGTIEAMAAAACAGGATPTAANVDTAVAALSLSVRNNFKEFTTTQIANRVAIIALTDAITELSARSNTMLAELKLAGLIS